jgi:hypothetical protein
MQRLVEHLSPYLLDVIRRVAILERVLRNAKEKGRLTSFVCPNLVAYPRLIPGYTGIPASVRADVHVQIIRSTPLCGVRLCINRRTGPSLPQCNSTFRQSIDTQISIGSKTIHVGRHRCSVAHLVVERAWFRETDVVRQSRPRVDFARIRRVVAGLRVA